MSVPERTQAVTTVLNNIVGNDVGKDSEIWCMKGTAKAAGGAKVTFKDTNTRFSAEKKLSTNRDRAGKQTQSDTLIFTTSRLVPMEFMAEKRTMEQEAKEKISCDWSLMVEKHEETGGPKEWESDTNLVKRCLRIRLNWKLKPQLTIWTEVQYPIHRYMWRTVNLSEISKTTI